MDVALVLNVVVAALAAVAGALVGIVNRLRSKNRESVKAYLEHQVELAELSGLALARTAAVARPRWVPAWLLGRFGLLPVPPDAETRLPPAPPVVAFNLPDPSTEEEMEQLVDELELDFLESRVADLERAVRTREDSGEKDYAKTRNAVLIGAAVVGLPALLNIGFAVFQGPHDAPVDCVVFVNSIADLQKDFPGREFDPAALRDVYGDRVVEQCGDPATLFG